MLIRLLRWLRGYLVISAVGGLGERFLSLCGRRNVMLWGMKAGDRLQACVLASDFKRIRRAAAKSGVRIRIEKRCGLPFLLQRYRYRKLFAAGLVLFLAILFFLSSLVWRIEVKGVSQTDLIALQKILEKNGIEKWSWSRGIDTDQARYEILQQMETVSWVGISRHGTEICVEIKERSPSPEMIPQEEPCELTAAKDGVIALMLVRDGEAKVKVGDTVSRGQLLVSAMMGVEEEGNPLEVQPVPVHAFGEVIARTWTVKSRDIPLKYDEKEPIGKPKHCYSMKISKILIKFFGNTGNLGSECDTIEEREWNIGAVCLQRRTVQNFSVTNRQRSAEDAAALGEQEMTRELSCELPEGAQLVSVSREVTETTEGTVRVSCTFECLENIAVQRAYVSEEQGDLPDDRENNTSGTNGTRNGSDG